MVAGLVPLVELEDVGVAQVVHDLDLVGDPELLVLLEALERDILETAFSAALWG